MRNSLIVLVFVFFSTLQLQIHSQVTQQWVRTYNGSGNGNDHIGDIALDGYGNIYVTGAITGTGTGYDACTMKLSSAGQILWVRNYNLNSGSVNEQGAKIEVKNDDGIYVAGISGNDVAYFDLFLIKYDTAGNVLWTRTYNGPGNRADILYDMVIDENSLVTMVGYTGKPNTTNTYDCLTLRYNASGSLLWTGIYESPEITDEIGWRAAPGKYGDVFVCGYKSNGAFLIKYNYSGNYISVRQINDPRFRGVDAISVTSDTVGNSIMAYSVLNDSGYYYNMNVFKTSPTGNLLWDSLYISDFQRDWEIRELNTDRHGNVYLIGDESGNISENFLTMKISSTGERKWMRFYDAGFNMEDHAYSLEIDRNGGIVVCGSSRFPGNNRSTTVKYDSSGSLLWTYSYPSKGDNSAVVVAMDHSNDAVYLAGEITFNHNISFDYLLMKLIQPIGIQPISSEIPNQFSLSQNYPNPFNPVTKIMFSIPAALSTGDGSGVRLFVYDILGREVATLVNEQLKPGTYEVDFNGSNYANGIYFYQLNVNTPRPDKSGHPSQEGIYTETKKMILIK